MTSEERRAALQVIAAEVSVCTKCRLASGRTRAVPGEGHPDTEVMFVGEGPGFNEDQQGRPFVGAAGGLLTELLGSVGWKRDEVFITNVVKCRPPGNRDPEPDEIAACAPYLRRQLEVIDPALIVTLGRFSLQTFMPGARIGQVHGTARPADPETGANGATAFAMYHPAAAFRQGSLKQTMQLDMCQIPGALQRAREARNEGETTTRADTAAPTAPTPTEAAPIAATPIEVARTAAVPIAAAPMAAERTTIDIAVTEEVVMTQELIAALPDGQSDAAEPGLWS
ncbi:MAG: uracil-DNA glycosylase [Chloroflexota bacterium]|nr:uracil-DNA glycosylase [Chloroflexota bacterium]